jgi:transcriptional regulator with XRE-family HTH domain
MSDSNTAVKLVETSGGSREKEVSSDKKKKVTRTPKFNVDEKLNLYIVESPIYDMEMRKYIYNGIAQNIRVEMEKRGLTVRRLAMLSGVEYSHLANILKEKQQIGLQTLICVAYAMEMTPAELFPFDFNTRKSNGARFDDLTKECDLTTVNTILGMVADIVKDIRRIKHSL